MTTEIQQIIDEIEERGALFVAIVKRACADRGIAVGLGQPHYASRS